MCRDGGQFGSQLAPGIAEEDVERWVPSASVLHSNGDAIEIAVNDGRIVGVRSRAEDRVNHGRLGPKDLAEVEHAPAAQRSAARFLRRPTRSHPPFALPARRRPCSPHQ